MFICSFVQWCTMKWLPKSIHFGPVTTIPSIPWIGQHDFWHGPCSGDHQYLADNTANWQLKLVFSTSQTLQVNVISITPKIHALLALPVAFKTGINLLLWSQGFSSSSRGQIPWQFPSNHSLVAWPYSMAIGCFRSIERSRNSPHSSSKLSKETALYLYNDTKVALKWGKMKWSKGKKNKTGFNNTEWRVFNRRQETFQLGLKISLKLLEQSHFLRIYRNAFQFFKNQSEEESNAEVMTLDFYAEFSSQLQL